MRAGDTVEGISSRYMAHLDHAAERFRVLNGLGANDGLKPGDKAKLIVE